ncbi:MAG: hypothetical protein QG552_3913 [Thermodesulfobacteriota bacterium]|nr:hypothetical protein [Thermodesulfobacteriota bacterium]
MLGQLGIFKVSQKTLPDGSRVLDILYPEPGIPYLALTDFGSSLVWNLHHDGRRAACQQCMSIPPSHL